MTHFKHIGITLAALFGLLGGVYGFFVLTDGRYFLRAEAQNLQQTLEQQRIDSLYRDKTDLLRVKRQQKRLSDYEQERLQEIDRQIKQLERKQRQ